MKAKAATILFETLKAYGVTHLFGLEEPAQLYQALDLDVIKTITIRDEKHGAIMAHGYTKATNRPGICTSLRGPGAANLVPGLAEALKSSTPLIAIVQEMATYYRGKNASSEFEQEKLLQPVVKWVERLDNPNRIAEMTRKVFRIATSGRPGPVAIICPSDILDSDAEAEVYVEADCNQYPSMRFRASEQSIIDAIDLLTKAKRPVIIAGGGCIISRAWNPLLRLSEIFKIPVATTMMGKGIIPENHPLSTGVMGSTTGGKLGRGRIANNIISQSDVAFIIGSRTDQDPYFNWTLPQNGTKVIHLDIDPAEIGRNFKTDVSLVGDARETLKDIIKYCIENQVKMQNEDVSKKIKKMKDDWFKSVDALSHSGVTPIRPEYVLNVLSSYIDSETIVVPDASYISMWVMNFIENKSSSCNFISPRALAGIGWALPAALGAKIGLPHKNVFCLSGDGAFGYVMNELETASRYNIKVITLIFNNSMYGYQRHYEELAFGKTVDCQLSEIDYSQVAKALNCKGERVEAPEKIHQAITRALEANGPYLIDIAIDPNAIPPISMFDGFEQAKH